MEKKNSLLSNLSWKFAERVTAQLVTLVVSIVLARILEPSHYGTIAIVTIFISLANVFVSDGFGSALIQKKDADILDFSSVLYFNIGFSIVLYLMLFFVAPFISRFYGEGYEILTPVLRVVGLRLIASGINSVQQAYVSKNMIFKKFFLATLLGTIASGVVGIVMALYGFGVWALVAQYLTNTTVDTIVLGVSLRKKPILAFSWSRLKSMLKYGSRVLGTGLLIAGYQDIRALIIGKMYSAEELAFFNKGKQFPNLIVTNINTSIGAVLFPKMSAEQDDTNAVKTSMRNSIRFSAYTMAPMMLGLAAVAESFVRLILTDKWLPCVSFLQLFCLFYLFQPIHTTNMQAIRAVGRSDINLKLELIKKAIELVVLLVVMWISVDAIAISMAVMATLFIFVNAYPNTKLLNYSIKEQLSDILPSLLMASGMAVCVYFVGYINFSKIFTLIIQIITGAIVYILASIITKSREFTYIITMIKQKLYKVHTGSQT